ncbi:598_t:CDS:2 [Racocetra fulgida]|uniref:598_t:CDS:1 n=1 Tax=Racocetra fulgida TaxID=60492 RepID=A0A9N9FAR6_9GLOM|nr:598_t:CDS:2 [Racocetra fulgida]
MLMKNITPLKNFEEGCFFLLKYNDFVKYINIKSIINFILGLYAGWFGPIGIGAVFYAALAKQDGSENVQKLVTPEDQVIKIVDQLTIKSETSKSESSNFDETITVKETADNKVDVNLDETITVKETADNKVDVNLDETITIKETTDNEVDDTYDIKDTGENNSAKAGLEPEEVYEEFENVVIEEDGDRHVYVTPNPP